MKIILAPDSFKQSMTSRQAIHAMQQGILSVLPQANVIGVPMADGGEGTVDALVHATHGQFVLAPVLNPKRQKVNAQYGILGDGKTAVIEMAAASGIQFTTPHRMVPMSGTTFGTGQLILDALDHHIKRLIIGLGGSATTDGGQGMAEALGVRFYDDDHQLLPAGGGQILSKIAQIDCTHLDPRLKKVEIKLASDVSNPLCGKNGAAYVFAAQKGANHEMIKQLDRNLYHYGKMIEHTLHQNIMQHPGAGAAGGLGAGLLTFTHAKLESGVKIVIEETQLKSKLIHSDVVITGEGSIDTQTQYGKTPVGVSEAAKAISPHALVIAFGGRIMPDVQVLYSKGIDAIFPIISGACDLTTAMKQGPMNLKMVTANLFRLIQKQNTLLSNSK